MRKQDFEFIMGVLQEKKVEISEDLDWYGIMGFLELNKISGYFYNKTKDLELKLPQNIGRKLLQILNIQTARNSIMRKYIQEFSDKLNCEKLKYAFLKGSVLTNANLNFSELSFSCFHQSPDTLLRFSMERLNTFYRQGERISNDIDILIKPKDIMAVTKILKELGYKQGYYDFKNQRFVELDRKEILSRRMNRGETAPFILEINNQILPFIEIDVNFSLDYLPSANSNMLENILMNAVDFCGSVKGGIKSLGVGDFFLHLIMHQYKESILYSMVERCKDLELYKLLDMYLFLKRGMIDFSGLYNSVKKYGIEKETYYVLNILNTVFDNICVADFMETIRPTDLSYIEEVIEPTSKRTYKWQIPLGERILNQNKIPFLKETEND